MKVVHRRAPKQCEMNSENEMKTGVKVEGELGCLRIEEINNDNDENITSHADYSDKTLSHIPTGLLHPSHTPVFGSVAVTSSDNVQFGNNTYFNGPVTIKQIIQKSGIDNGAYVKSENEFSHEEQINSNFKSTLEKSLNCKIQNWQLIAFFSLSTLVLGGICAIILSFSKANQDTKNSNPNAFETDNFNTLVTDSYWSSLTYSLMLCLIILFSLSIVLFNIFIYLNAYIMWRSKMINNFKLKQSKDEHLLIAQEHLRIVPREDWLAQPVEKPLDPMRLPIPWVVITHTATEGCNTQGQCILRVRLMQNFHIESKGWYDIGYNFLVGGDGSVYMGRGWDNVGAHTKGYNIYSLGVALIGTFNKEKPPKRQMDALQKLLELGVKLGKLKSDYILFAHSHLMSTISPGEAVREIIKTWPHFVKNDTNINDLLPKY